MGSEATINDNDSNVVIVLLWICLFICSLIFYAWFKFYFLLLLGMIMYDNELHAK